MAGTIIPTTSKKLFANFRPRVSRPEVETSKSPVPASLGGELLQQKILTP
jgi:hypothetical protein